MITGYLLKKDGGKEGKKRKKEVRKAPMSELEPLLWRLNKSQLQKLTVNT